MSLEQALAENTQTLKQLIVVLQSAGVVTSLGAPASGDSQQAADAAAETAKRTRRTKAEMAAAAAAEAAAAPGYLRPGDAPGTRYWHIEKHNTVYLQKPGDADCTIQGALLVSGAEYDHLVADYAAKFPTSAGAATAAATTPSAAPASTASPAASPAAAPAAASNQGDAITAKCKELHAAKGNAGLAELLKKFGAGRVPALAAMTDKTADILAAADALINPDSNLFG